MESQNYAAELQRLKKETINEHLTKTSIQKRIKVFGQNVDYKNRTPLKVSYQVPTKIDVKEDLISKIGSKKILLSSNPLDTDPFNLGSTDKNIASALLHYQTKVASKHQQKLDALQKDSLVEYFESKQKILGTNLKFNNQVTNYQGKKKHLAEGKNSAIQRLEKFEIQQLNKLQKLQNPRESSRVLTEGDYKTIALPSISTRKSSLPSILPSKSRNAHQTIQPRSDVETQSQSGHQSSLFDKIMHHQRSRHARAASVMDGGTDSKQSKYRNIQGSEYQFIDQSDFHLASNTNLDAINKNYNSQIISQGTLIQIDENSIKSNKNTILKTQINRKSKNTMTPTPTHVSSIKPKPELKKRKSPKLYQNAEEISRDSYSDIELSPKANDPKNLKIKLDKKRHENEQQQKLKLSKATHMINMKVTEQMKNRIHTGLTSSPKIKVAADWNQVAVQEAKMQKFQSQLNFGNLNQSLTRLQNTEEIVSEEEEQKNPEDYADDRAPSESGARHYSPQKRVSELRLTREASTKVDDMLDKLDIYVENKNKPVVRPDMPMLSTHQLAIVRRKSIEPVAPSFDIYDPHLKYQNENDPTQHSQIKLSIIADRQDPPQLPDIPQIAKKVEKELHFVATRDKFIMNKLIEGDQDLHRQMRDILDRDSELRKFPDVVDLQMTKKNLERLNSQFFAHLEATKFDYKTPTGMPILSYEYEQMMKKALYTFHHEFNQLPISEKIALRALVKVPREQWTLEQRDNFINRLIKEEGVTWLNYQERMEYILQHIPSMLTKEDVTLQFVPNLFVRSIAKIYEDCADHTDYLWGIYYEWRKKNRILEHRRAMKEQTTFLLKKYRVHFERQKVLKDRQCMYETFGRAMWTKDGMKYRNKRFKKIKQSAASEEDTDHNSDNEKQYDLHFDNQLDKYDQYVTGADALLHQYDLYKDVDKYAEEYEYFEKDMKSPLMNFFMLLTGAGKRTQAPKTFGLTHRRNAQEIMARSFYITDEYIDPLSKAFHLSENLRKLDLSRTHLSKENCRKMVLHLPETLESVNFSHNCEFGGENVKLICSVILDDPRYQLESLILEECEIGDEGLIHLGIALEQNRKLKFLDVSKNGITHKGCIPFCESLKENSFLQILFLHWNPRIKYKGGKAIAEMLQKNDGIQMLDISFCDIGFAKDGGPTYYEVVRERWRLENLPKMPNKNQESNIPLTAEQKIEREARKKAKIKKKLAEEAHQYKLPPSKKKWKLDEAAAKEWLEAFKKNETLVHLDMSHNGFSSKEVEIFREGLDENHTIYGLHFAGNEAATDAMGFVNHFDHDGIKEFEDIGKHTVFLRIKPNLKGGVVRNLRQIRLQATNNCWICEGWSEVKFEFEAPYQIDVDIVPVKLHLSCDNYLGELLDVDEELSQAAQVHEDERIRQKNFTEGKTVAQKIEPALDQATGMRKVELNSPTPSENYQPDQELPQVPDRLTSTENDQTGLDPPKTPERPPDKVFEGKFIPRKMQVFSIIRMVPPGVQNYYFSIGEKENFTNPSQPQVLTSKVIHGGPQLLKLNVPKTNIVMNIIQHRDLFDKQYRQDLTSYPRPPPFIMKGRLKVKTPWDFMKSVFKTYKPDNQRILDDCFDIDWANNKCEKVIKVEEEIKKSHDYLKSIYKSIREVYKYYAGISPLGRIASTSSQTITECLSHCNAFVDGKQIKSSDVDLEIIACQGGQRVQNWLSPAKGIVRHQFMEVLVRLCLDKFFKTKLVQTQSEAIIKGFDEYLLPYFSTFDCHGWRKERLWKEENDLLYSRFLKQLDMIYKKYSGKYATPGSNVQTMSLEEFVQMLQDGRLIDENFGNREAGPLFNVSLMTNRKELETEKHLNMSFVEFLESLARVADKLSLSNLEDHFPEYKSKNNYNLDKKLESVCIIMIKNILSEKQSNFAIKSYGTLVANEIEAEKKGQKTQFKKR